MKTVNIYTDGACSGNQNDNNIGGWGCVLEFGEHRKELHGGEINTTNNRMELTALVSALECLKEKNLSLRIFSDSSYLVNCFRSKWYVKWQQNGWKNSAKQPVENRELWEKLLALLEGQSPSFYLVKGHLNLSWAEDKLRPHFEKFKSHNGDLFSYDEWMKIVSMNIRCDELANVFVSETNEKRQKENLTED